MLPKTNRETIRLHSGGIPYQPYRSTAGYPEHGTPEEISEIRERLKDAEQKQRVAVFTVACGNDSEKLAVWLSGNVHQLQRPVQVVVELSYKPQQECARGEGRIAPDGRMGNSMSGFEARIGTRTGDRHARKGTGNQDFACYAPLPGDKGIVAAVSDGAGSAARAANGSRPAAEAAVEGALASALEQGDDINDNTIVLEGMRAAGEALEAKSQSDGAALEDYHATLSIAGVSESYAAVAHIGDGASIVKVEGKYKMLTIPARGMYPNETFFVTMEGYEEMIATNDTCGVTEMILFTDGVQNELIDFQGKKPQTEAVESAVEAAGGPRQGSDESTLLSTLPDLGEWLESRERTHRGKWCSPRARPLSGGIVGCAKRGTVA